MTPDYLLPVFSFRPNWADGITETLEWLTDLLDAKRSGAEQRIALRLTPRRSFEAKLDLLDQERTFGDLFIRRFHGAEFMLPLWHDHAQLDATANIGSGSLSFDTTDREFVAGGMALLMGSDALSCEAVRVDTVTAGGLTLVNPVANQNWPTGTSIHPLRRSRFDPQLTKSQMTDSFDRINLRFELNQSNALDGGAEELELYAGLPILAPSPDWSRTLDSDWLRNLFTVDNKLGLKFVNDPAGRGFHSQQHRWMLEGRADLAAFRRLLYRLRGRQGSIWLPSFTSDLTLAADAAAGALHLDVVKCGLNYTDFPAAGREYAITEAGEVLNFASLAAPPSSSSERLNLATALAAPLSTGDVLSWVDVGRLDNDRIELFHLTDSDGVTTIEAVFRTFSNTRDGSAEGALDLPVAAMNSAACGDTLIGLSWLLPCLSVSEVGPNLCDCAAASNNSVLMPGVTGQDYDVTFRVRGVVEVLPYIGGTALYDHVVKDPTGAGGTDVNYNHYKLIVSNPAAEYYLNANATNVENMALDYEITIPIKGGATLTLDAVSIDSLEFQNEGNLAVADDDPLRPVVVTQPYNGQFMQIDLLEAV
jgi:hypothetical protein